MTYLIFSAQDKKSLRGIKWAGTKLSQKMAALFLCMALGVFPAAVHAEEKQTLSCQELGIVGNAHAEVPSRIVLEFDGAPSGFMMLSDQAARSMV
jgi:hypothetical protein